MSNKKTRILIYLLFSLVIFFIDKQFPFFWDNVVQISFPANWYYDNNFSSIFLPDGMTTGHPTFVGMYIALFWKLLGKKLWVSHLAVLPFTWGLFIQLDNFTDNIGIKNIKEKLLIIIFIILDTTMLAQMSLITFEIIQIFFFFLILNKILSNRTKTISFIFYFTILMLISLRSVIMGGGLIVFHIIYLIFIKKQKFSIKNLLIYLPGIISFAVFLLLFELNKGWIIHNPNTNAWSKSTYFASVKGILKNIVIFVWRLLDFGRIGIYLFSLYIFIGYLRRKIKFNQSEKIILLIAFTQFLVFFPILIIFQNPIGHRYLMLINISITIFVVDHIYNNYKRNKILLSILLLILVSGHFWLYPLKISQGWDSTTLHWNYFQLDDEIQKYIQKNHIDKSEIATFPINNTLRYYTHLADDKTEYKGELFRSKYILFSNIFNPSDSSVDSLFNKNGNWKPMVKKEKNGIIVILFEQK